MWRFLAETQRDSEFVAEAEDGGGREVCEGSGKSEGQAVSLWDTQTCSRLQSTMGELQSLMVTFVLIVPLKYLLHGVQNTSRVGAKEGMWRVSDLSSSFPLCNKTESGAQLS